MKLIGGGGGWFARECLLSALALGSTFVRVVIHFLFSVLWFFTEVRFGHYLSL
ncbi:MAG: hypothetical protein ACI8Z5_002060 [Lentimonas sp.]|jgi:hypothetical protein